MNAVQLKLKAARDLIDTPEKWCKGANARDADGNAVSPSNPAACQRCAETALDGDLTDRAVRAAWMHFREAIYPRACVFIWQDAPERTHAEVMQAFDRAIERAGQQ